MKYSSPFSYMYVESSECFVNASIETIPQILQYDVICIVLVFLTFSLLKFTIPYTYILKGGAKTQQNVPQEKILEIFYIKLLNISLLE